MNGGFSLNRVVTRNPPKYPNTLDIVSFEHLLIFNAESVEHFPLLQRFQWVAQPCTNELISWWFFGLNYVPFCISYQQQLSQHHTFKPYNESFFSFFFTLIITHIGSLGLVYLLTWVDMYFSTSHGDGFDSCLPRPRVPHRGQREFHEQLTVELERCRVWSLRAREKVRFSWYAMLFFSAHPIW